MGAKIRKNLIFARWGENKISQKKLGVKIRSSFICRRRRACHDGNQ